MPTKVLLDTDIGSDIDDAVALAYLLAQPDCDLLGITTCTGNTQQRAALAGALCDAAGRSEVPIHAGAAGPFFTGPGQKAVPQYAALQDKTHRTGFPEDGVEFLRRTIRAHPGEVTLLAIGPLTNLALAFRLDPELPSMLGRLVLMNGSFLGFADRGTGHPGGPGAREWNVRCDPFASAVVYDANCPGHLSVGLDVTTQCTMPAAGVRERFRAASPTMSLAADLAEVWFERYELLTFHDPLAAAAIFEPTLCETVRGRVRIETTSPHLTGVSAFDADAIDKPHAVASGVDPDKFFKHFFAVTG